VRGAAGPEKDRAATSALDRHSPAGRHCFGGHQALFVQYAEAGDENLIRLIVVSIDFVIRDAVHEVGIQAVRCGQLSEVIAGVSSHPLRILRMLRIWLVDGG
jgi:hypothetical protein